MGKNNRLDEVFVDELLIQVVEAHCSELHLEVGRPPYMSERGTDGIIELTGYEPARPSHIQRLIYDILSDEQIEVFEQELSLLFTHMAPHVARFNVFIARDAKHISATFRIMPSHGRDII